MAEVRCPSQSTLYTEKYSTPGKRSTSPPPAIRRGMFFFYSINVHMYWRRCLFPLLRHSQRTTRGRPRPPTWPLPTITRGGHAHCDAVGGDHGGRAHGASADRLAVAAATATRSAGDPCVSRWWLVCAAPQVCTIPARPRHRRQCIRMGPLAARPRQCNLDSAASCPSRRGRKPSVFHDGQHVLCVRPPVYLQAVEPCGPHGAPVSRRARRPGAGAGSAGRRQTTAGGI